MQHYEDRRAGEGRGQAPSQGSTKKNSTTPSRRGATTKRDDCATAIEARRKPPVETKHVGDADDDAP